MITFIGTIQMHFDTQKIMEEIRQENQCCQTATSKDDNKGYRSDIEDKAASCGVNKKVYFMTTSLRTPVGSFVATEGEIYCRMAMRSKPGNVVIVHKAVNRWFT